MFKVFAIENLYLIVDQENEPIAIILDVGKGCVLTGLTRNTVGVATTVDEAADEFVPKFLASLEVMHAMLGGKEGTLPN